eukprot:5504724-Amphidinium_carterae.1
MDGLRLIACRHECRLHSKLLSYLLRRAPSRSSYAASAGVAPVQSVICSDHEAKGEPGSCPRCSSCGGFRPTSQLHA